MPTSLFNSIASWILKKRIHQIELFIKYPEEVQNELLNELLKTAQNTETGIRYNFKEILNYKDFRASIPLSTYESIAPQIERCRNGTQNIFWPSPIKWFAKSSGTTNAKSKFIPVSTEALEDCHYKAGKDMLSLYFNNNPDSQLLSGKCLRLGGSHELYNENNSYFGDLSAIIIQNMPFWAELSSTPSHKTSLMSEWEAKMKAIVTETLPERVTSLAGVPSWMLLLLQKVLKETNKQTITDIWPEAEVYFHGGVSFKPYKELYKNLFPKAEFKFYEIYNASEGFFGIQDRNDADDLLLMLDYGIFYEFIPFHPSSTAKKEHAIPLSEVHLNTNYELVITTNAGLWRYRIGDTIRFTSLTPYRIQVTGRTKHHINAFGEELIIDNAERAISIVSQQTDSVVSNYTAAPVFMKNNTKGAHEWIVEFEKEPKDVQDFSKLLDQSLQKLNSDYEAKRNSSLDQLKLHKGKTGLFYEWLSFKNKLGGQHKIPRLSNSRALLEELLEMNAS
ncbi:GH3 auxin-responsive promoter family protein [Flavobacteriaceae bacterium]|nr:GH3 auxin-responsive promoter family protein [Flavobacteriaceae bacterium]MDC3354135.1 GH3 auxin-responsive promoter family protein [Flavobacteriaceae bacterium]